MAFAGALTACIQGLYLNLLHLVFLLLFSSEIILCLFFYYAPVFIFKWNNFMVVFELAPFGIFYYAPALILILSEIILCLWNFNFFLNV